jgi:hypothetical protein
MRSPFTPPRPFILTNRSLHAPHVGGSAAGPFFHISRCTHDALGRKWREVDTKLVFSVMNNECVFTGKCARPELNMVLWFPLSLALIMICIAPVALFITLPRKREVRRALS